MQFFYGGSSSFEHRCDHIHLIITRNVPHECQGDITWCSTIMKHRLNRRRKPTNRWMLASRSSVDRLRTCQQKETNLITICRGHTY